MNIVRAGLYGLLATTLLACRSMALPDAVVNDHSAIEELAAQNRTLTQRVAALEARQNDLERSIAVLASSAPQPVAQSANSTHNAGNDVYRQAQQAFSAGQYARAVTLLQAYPNHTTNNENVVQGLWLLARSHEKLAHCESAMQVAHLLERRFARHEHAPDALLLVARCQIKMQQKDIARDTVRRLNDTYPDSRAAKNAAQLFKK
ncbi:MAG: tetratricopeptide repeat protein [Neisseria sp.]|nr:tetratricopeptide repeat protein [Neisseria sp.]